ncbi:MAG: hypothetical protein ACK41C_14605 [Phenylobacterium sp.]
MAEHSPDPPLPPLPSAPPRFKGRIAVCLAREGRDLVLGDARGLIERAVQGLGRHAGVACRVEGDRSRPAVDPRPADALARPPGRNRGPGTS